MALPVTKEQIADAVQKLADDIRSGEVDVRAFNQNVDHGYHSSTLGKNFYFRKNPMTITLRINVKSFQKEEEEALMQALTASGRSPL